MFKKLIPNSIPVSRGGTYFKASLNGLKVVSLSICALIVLEKNIKVNDTIKIEL
jgi:hypothetical protein